MSLRDRIEAATITRCARCATTARVHPFTGYCDRCHDQWLESPEWLRRSMTGRGVAKDLTGKGTDQ
jgi:hypothetical protein